MESKQNFQVLLQELREIRSTGSLTSDSNARKNEIIGLISENSPNSIRNIMNEVDNIVSKNQYQQYSLALDLCTIIGKIGGEEAFQYLIKILNTESQYAEFNTVIIGAVIGLKCTGDKRSIEYLNKIKSKNHNVYVTNNINDALNTLGMESNQPRDIISKGELLSPKESIAYFTKYQEQAKNWDNDSKRYYFSVLAAKIKAAFKYSGNAKDSSDSEILALPYYAAALVADPDPNTVGWQYFNISNNDRNKATAIKLSQKYPLPTEIPFPSVNEVNIKDSGFFKKISKLFK